MKKTSKIIAVLAVLIAGSMIASGVLLPYLSNEVTAEITVSSPMVASISEGKESWGGDSFLEGQACSSEWATTITISDIHGGETITIYTMSANIAEAEITGFEKARVTNWAGVTSDDFESVVVRTDSIYRDLGYGTAHELIPDGCHQIDACHVWFGSPENSLWGIGETDVTEIVVTFEEAASGTYLFTFQVVPAI